MLTQIVLTLVSLIICIHGVPLNDDCTGALPLALGVPQSGTTIDATSEDMLNCPSDTLNAVWYYLDVPSAAVYTMSLCNMADYDTRVSVYSGSCGSMTLTCEAQNDDYEGCGATSRVSVTATGATRYYIAVSGFAEEEVGNFDIVAFIGVPVNDDCTGALPLALGVPQSGTTIGATSEDMLNCPSTTLNAVWYYLDVPSAAVYTISLCNTANYDTRVSVYSGSCGSMTLTCEAQNDDSEGCSTTSQISVTATGATRYYIAVSGFVLDNVGNFDIVAFIADSESPSASSSASQSPSPASLTSSPSTAASPSPPMASPTTIQSGSNAGLYGLFALVLLPVLAIALLIGAALWGLWSTPAAVATVEGAAATPAAVSSYYMPQASQPAAYLPQSFIPQIYLPAQ